MNFGIKGLEILKEKINSTELKELGRNKPVDFTRNRKMDFSNVIYYSLNKKGLCTSMEINNFFEKTAQDLEISGQALLDQRLKLNPAVFAELNKAYLDTFFREYKNNVKTFKCYILKAIDGSDIEVPNTNTAKEHFGVAKSKCGSVARASISTAYDLLNHYIIDGIVERYRSDEIKMAIRHIEKNKDMNDGYESIYIMDRNYVSIGFMSYMIKNNIKFLSRLKASSHYVEETMGMQSDDEIIELKHTESRMRKHRFHSEEIREYAKSKPSTRIRIVKYTLTTGETEYLITNLEEFTYEEIVSLYEKRWGIETLYYSLKSKLQIEKFTSSTKIIIEQDFLSSILVYNIVQTMKNEAEELLVQDKYKHEMRVNENIAIGLLKNELIKIMLEKNHIERMKLYDKLTQKLLKYKVPIRKNRKYGIKFKNDNHNSFNKLKSF